MDYRYYNQITPLGFALIEAGLRLNLFDIADAYYRNPWKVYRDPWYVKRYNTLKNLYLRMKALRTNYSRLDIYNMYVCLFTLKNRWKPGKPVLSFNHNQNKVVKFLKAKISYYRAHPNDQNKQRLEQLENECRKLVHNSFVMIAEPLNEPRKQALARTIDLMAKQDKLDFD